MREQINSLQRRLWVHLALSIVTENIVLISVYVSCRHYLPVQPLSTIGVTVIVGILLTSLLSVRFAKAALAPLTEVGQAILHIAPTDEHAEAAPEVDALRYGRSIVATLTTQLYQFATAASHLPATAPAARSMDQNFVANNLPLPLIVLDASETIRFANAAASGYIGVPITDLIGKNVYMVLDMLFPSNETFDTWLKSVKQSAATASTSWERVKLRVSETHPERYFDLAAYYNKDNPERNETLLVLFDHTKEYSQDDQAVSFIALSVHELRTPLTLLRGYIEVFDEELAGKTTPELADFMQKMKATSQQLTSFVNNILNVARVDGDQLELKLQQEDWASVLQQAIDNISLRASVRGIKLTSSLAPELPPVGIDRLSIQEVINNLIDNAIKYSGKSTEIKVESHLNREGFIETSVTDYGVGINSAVLPNLFNKFYRDHRNRAQIGGTGLGLYLSHAIITAHGGNIWVRSQEGQGSTFSFTVLPYEKLAAAQKASGEQADIVRSAHGWIKNHSLYRR